jgi:Fe-S cluster biogenesis protein NfuA
MAVSVQDLIYERVERALDDIRPHLEVDGGNIEVVEITDDYLLKLKWIGTCEFCSMSAMTLKAGVEHSVKSQVPEISGIEVINGVMIA